MSFITFLSYIMHEKQGFLYVNSNFHVYCYVTNMLLTSNENDTTIRDIFNHFS